VNPEKDIWLNLERNRIDSHNVDDHVLSSLSRHVVVVAGGVNSETPVQPYYGRQRP
jgi:hypothetical protein